MAINKTYNVNVPPTTSSPDGTYRVKISDTPAVYDEYTVSNGVVVRQNVNDVKIAQLASNVNEIIEQFDDSLQESLGVLKKITGNVFQVGDESLNIIFSYTEDGRAIFHTRHGEIEIKPEDGLTEADVLGIIRAYLSALGVLSIGGHITIKEGRFAFSIEDENGYCGMIIDNTGQETFVAGINISSSGTVEEKEILPEYLAEVNHIVVFGQSLTQETAGDAVSTSQRYNSIGFDSGMTDFVALVQTGGEKPAFGIADALIESVINQENMSIEQLGLQFLLSTTPMPGSPIDSFVKGTGAYNTFLNQVQSAYNIAQEKALSYNCIAFAWIQGEHGGADYRDKFIQLRKDLSDDVKDITGQTNDLKCVTYQTTQIGIPPYEIATAQLDAVIEDENFFMATTLNNIETDSLTLGDGLHLSPTGAYSLGYALGKGIFDFVLLKTKKKGNVIIPDQVKAIGNTALITYQDIQGELMFDSENVPFRANQGFWITGENDSPSVASVQIIEGKKIKLIFSRILKKGDVIGYGRRGNLRDQYLKPVTLPNDDIYKLFHWGATWNLGVRK
jgi:hypothetical protein